MSSDILSCVFMGYFVNSIEYPNPTEDDLKDPAFEAIWAAIKQWDLSRSLEPNQNRMYAGATGNDVMHILFKLRQGCLLKDAK